MGFESIISGHIAVNPEHQSKEQIARLKSEIIKLPKLEDDTWPFLPRDIFHISTPVSADFYPVKISYRSIMITFAMSVKQVEDELAEWIEKFEGFLKAIPKAYEAKVIVKLEPYTSLEINNGYLNYFWEKQTDMTGNRQWSFKGEPTNPEEICNSRHKTNKPISAELKAKVISCFQWLKIEDFLTTNKGNYDRHFTQYSRMNFILTHFGVRTSGAVARIAGDQQQFEFKSDYIISINQSSNTIEINLDIGEESSRRIVIEVENHQVN